MTYSFWTGSWVSPLVAVAALLLLRPVVHGRGLAPTRPPAQVFREAPRLVVLPPDPDRGPGPRHRRFPCAWWQSRCHCQPCSSERTRKPDYARIEAGERECGIRREDGELVWPPPEVGSQDQHGRTVVAVVEGMPVWDRPAPPGPPPRDPGRKQWV